MDLLVSFVNQREQFPDILFAVCRSVFCLLDVSSELCCMTFSDYF